MSKTQKIYVANGTEKFDGDLVEFSLNLTKLKSEAGEHIFDYNGDKYIKLKIAKKRDGAVRKRKKVASKSNKRPPSSGTGLVTMRARNLTNL